MNPDQVYLILITNWQDILRDRYPANPSKQVLVEIIDMPVLRFSKGIIHVVQADFIMNIGIGISSYIYGIGKNNFSHEKIRENKRQLDVQASGDPAVERVLDAIEPFKGHVPDPPLSPVEHNVHVIEG